MPGLLSSYVAKFLALDQNFSDLMVLAAGTFTKCDILAFKLKAIKIHNKVDKNANSMIWDSAIGSLKNKYQILNGQGIWTPQETSNEKDDEFSGRHVSINNMTAQIHNDGVDEGGNGVVRR